ncbi:MAG: hypothetical protein A3F84_06660 [Candidatus Handelsmanbacteria bacterium RIFCSPLOWO2_12_FULL_64_10]|uniref:Uncharacterized protein n=1 Tax=Handelsmanbacteria sp. (strain RIFCSPLOWO2_12_FULL_64_10) TaxID=1817868 RepID=A0A1F6CM68_HANXR|nr:MAG: hypothetical protein A3F84_06660 [Candidatus Handelsmanbacteria bacterium RIFCSPLOWO2_12_FULL_64_10]
MRREKSWWRFGLELLLAFAIWSLLAGPLLPAYARAVIPVAQGIIEWLRPHDFSVVFTGIYPDVIWQAHLPSEVEQGGVSFQLLSYNLILYLTLLTAIPGVRLRGRVVLLLTGLPLLWIFHIVDLLLIVESWLLTRLRPESYVFWRHFDPWFLTVKFYASFSALALKPVFPILALFLQWHWLGVRRAPQSKGGRAAGGASVPEIIRKEKLI